MVSLGQVTGVVLGLSSGVLQQLALFRRDHVSSLGSRPDSRLSMFFGLGVMCELAALAFLPLATLTVLASVHVLVYVLLLTLEDDRFPQGAETKGLICISAGCM